MKRILALAAVVVLGLTPRVLSFSTFVMENFVDDPVANGRMHIDTGPGPGFGLNDGTTGNPVLMTWVNSAPLFAGDVAGHEEVHYDSSQPTTRLNLPLGQNVQESNGFEFEALMVSKDLVSSPYNDFMQVDDALTNEATTGSERATPYLTPSNTFDNVELAHYPQGSDFGGPFVTATVQGSDQGTGDAFQNMGFSSDAVALPLNTPLLFHGRNEDGDLRLRVYDMTGGVMNAMLADTTVNSGAHPFGVDTLSLTSYFDGADVTPNDISLVVDVEYHYLQFNRIPEPASLSLAALALLSVLRRRR